MDAPNHKITPPTIDWLIEAAGTTKAEAEDGILALREYIKRRFTGVRKDSTIPPQTPADVQANQTIVNRSHYDIVQFIRYNDDFSNGVKIYLYSVCFQIMMDAYHILRSEDDINKNRAN